jgi:subtilase family serine protease
MLGECPFMRKASVSVLVLFVLFTLLSIPFVVSAKGTTGLSADPLATLYAHPDFIRKSKATISPDIAGISPTLFRKAYGISSITQNGIGITIALVDACGNPGAQKDLNKYDTTFGLPATTIKVV